MRKGTLGVAMAACLMAFNAGTAKAETKPEAKSGNEIRVVNRHATTVRVYVQDANGGRHSLGRVAASDFKVMTVPAEISAMGNVQIKVYPVAPFEALTLAGVDGIQSRGIALDGKDALNMFVECDLQRSTVEIAKG